MQTTFDRLDEKGNLKSYITHHGKDAEGKQILPIVEYDGLDEVSGMSKKAKFKSLLLSADKDGRYSIKTEFYLEQQTGTGYKPDSSQGILEHSTEPSEAQTFVEQLFPMIERSVLNAVAIKIGHNTNRFFAPDGAPQNEQAHQDKPNDRAIVADAPVQ